MRNKNESRSSYELYKSTIRHQVKDMGDIAFLIRMLEEDRIRYYYDKRWYPEALYLLAMVDYLSKRNDVPLCTNYDDLRRLKLERLLYPSEVIVRCKLRGDDSCKHDALKKAMPEFLKYNIVECEIWNVV